MTAPNVANAIQVGDVVQIDPAHDPAFGACLLTVTELKSWGVQGFVRVPQKPQAVEAYYRVPFDKIARIGRAEWVPGASTIEFEERSIEPTPAPEPEGSMAIEHKRDSSLVYRSEP